MKENNSMLVHFPKMCKTLSWNSLNFPWKGRQSRRVTVCFWHHTLARNPSVGFLFCWVTKASKITQKKGKVATLQNTSSIVMSSYMKLMFLMICIIVYIYIYYHDNENILGGDRRRVSIHCADSLLSRGDRHWLTVTVTAGYDVLVSTVTVNKQVPLLLVVFPSHITGRMAVRLPVVQSAAWLWPWVLWALAVWHPGQALRVIHVQAGTQSQLPLTHQLDLKCSLPGWLVMDWVTPETAWAQTPCL